MTQCPGVSRLNSWRRPLGWLVLLAFTSNPLWVAAQNALPDEGPLKQGDVLNMAVPGRPDLNRQLVLNSDGKVTIPQVGEVKLAGLSVEEATVQIKRRLRLFYPTLDLLTLEKATLETNRIYVIGQVNQPGVHNFEERPSFWDVLRASGGETQQANLRDARVIREDESGPSVHPVDLSGLTDGTDIPDFELRDGDTIVIPALVRGLSGVPTSSGVKVFGGVAVPTVVPVDGPTPLMDILMLAGAPTATAELKKIQHVHNDGSGNAAKEINLFEYLELGDPAGNPLIYPGDTVNVTLSKPSWVRNNVPLILGSLAALATLWLAYYQTVINNN